VVAANADDFDAATLPEDRVQKMKWEQFEQAVFESDSVLLRQVVTRVNHGEDREQVMQATLLLQANVIKNQSQQIYTLSTTKLACIEVRLEDNQLERLVEMLRHPGNPKI
jgi:hypothetical protein